MIPRRGASSFRRREAYPHGVQCGPRLSQVVLVASGSHFGPLATRDVDSLDSIRRHVLAPSELAQSSWGKLSGLRAYGSAKLANVLYAGWLARSLGGSGVTACSLHPGRRARSNDSPWIVLPVVICCACQMIVTKSNGL